MQDDPSNFAPVCIFRRRVEQADVSNQTLFVVSREDRRTRGLVGDIRIKERWAHAIL